jgi:hypothetical protein
MHDEHETHPAASGLGAPAELTPALRRRHRRVWLAVRLSWRLPGLTDRRTPSVPFVARRSGHTFGTGYSSLAYLQHFPVDTLKIDRSFISTMADSPESGALIHTLVQLGKSLGLQTLAEGIEESAQYSQLEREHCDSGQGYIFARPLEADALEAFLLARSSRGGSPDESTRTAAPA